MIPCMQRIRKRVRGKNEQTQRCDCLLRCAPECGISILTCGQSLERFLPAFFNKRGKSGCWIPSQASTARSMEWSGGPRRAAGLWAGCWRSCIERRLCGRDIAPMWLAFELYQKEEEAQEAAECSWIRLQTNKQKMPLRFGWSGIFFWCQEFFSMYTLVEGKAKSTPSACMISMIFRFRSFCICRNSA